MAQQHRGGQYIQTEERGGGVIVARFVGDELGLFGRAAALLNCSISSSAPTAIPTFARWCSPGRIHTDSSAMPIWLGCKRTVRSFPR